MTLITTNSWTDKHYEGMRDVLQFRVGSQVTSHTGNGNLPARLETNARFPTDRIAATREFNFRSHMDMMWGINSYHLDDAMSRVLMRPPLGTVEKYVFRSDGMGDMSGGMSSMSGMGSKGSASGSSTHTSHHGMGGTGGTNNNMGAMSGMNGLGDTKGMIGMGANAPSSASSALPAMASSASSSSHSSHHGAGGISGMESAQNMGSMSGMNDMGGNSSPSLASAAPAMSSDTKSSSQSSHHGHGGMPGIDSSMSKGMNMKLRRRQVLGMTTSFGNMGMSKLTNEHRDHGGSWTHAVHLHLVVSASVVT